MTLQIRVAIAAALLFPLACLLGTASGQGQLDQVFLAKGTPTRGFITEMTRDQVTIEAMSVPRHFKVYEISRITFQEEPSELNAARTAVLQKNYNQALRELRKLEDR